LNCIVDWTRRVWCCCWREGW